MKFWEFVLALPKEQYIAWVDHTLPYKKMVYKNGKRMAKCVDPFTKPMRVGNITLERIGSQRNLYLKDIYGIQSCTKYKGKEIDGGLIFFHVTDKEETKMHLAMHNVLNIHEKHGKI